MKSILKIKLAFVFTSVSFASFAFDCEEAMKNVMKTSSEIRANHQQSTSFDLLEQQKLIDADQQIMQGNQYIYSRDYLTQNCN